jgi:MoaA/NifB/PqqE/SkfB family radical SAM enzyme
LKPEDWGKVWKRIHEMHGSVQIDLIGGEPFLYPEFDKVLKELAQYHRLLITTNLYLSQERLEAVLKGLSPEKVHFNISYHPEYALLEKFMGNAVYLKERGFAPDVLYVAWPPFLGEIDKTRKAFEERGFVFSLLTFQGTYAGKKYPDSYTIDEKNIIREMMKDLTMKDVESEYRLEKRNTLGRLCHAGRVYANIKGNGDVYRCGQDAFGHNPMGNIVDSRFSLFKKPHPCPYEHCSCSEFKFLDELNFIKK